MGESLPRSESADPRAHLIARNATDISCASEDVRVLGIRKANVPHGKRLYAERVS